MLGLGTLTPFPCSGRQHLQFISPSQATRIPFLKTCVYIYIYYIYIYIIYIYIHMYIHNYVYHISKKNNGCGLHVHLFSTAIFLSGIRLLWDSPQVKHCVHVAWLWQGSCGPSWRCHPLNTQGCTRRTTQGCPDSRSVWIWGI